MAHWELVFVSTNYGFDFHVLYIRLQQTEERFEIHIGIS
jgi:hypothetical protein